MADFKILNERKGQIDEAGNNDFVMACERHSLAGSISQRACVFCGSRVVLYPIADALHLIHGPIGCAAYTWDIRGALSSGENLHRMSFCTDLEEKDVVFGGADKLYRSLVELIDYYKPKAAFVYSTCIVGLIGDDIEAVCRRVEKEKLISVIPVYSEGFKGTKKDGYSAACTALGYLVGTGDIKDMPEMSINILGDFNLAGETWIIRDYYKEMGINITATITGDGKIDEIRRAHGTALNVVQCSGSMSSLAKMMQDKYGIPYIRVSYFGIEDMAQALYDVANHFNSSEALEKAKGIVKRESDLILPYLRDCRRDLTGKKAAIYVGGAFKAFSLVRALKFLGMRTILAGCQTGNAQDYEQLKSICDPDTIIIDDANALELAKFVKEKDADLLIGGVKERPIAYKLGVAFCDHNHERKEPLAGFVGMKNFAREVYSSVMSPVWQFVPRRSNTIKGGNNEAAF